MTRTAIFNRNVALVMARKPVYVTPQTTASEARRAARESGVDHLLVSECDELVGVTCACDLERAHPAVPVSRFLRSGVVTVDASATLRQAAEIMRERGVGCLPVVSGGLLLGVVTRADLLRAGLQREDVSKPCARCGRHHRLKAHASEAGSAPCQGCLEAAATSPDCELEDAADRRPAGL